MSCLRWSSFQLQHIQAKEVSSAHLLSPQSSITQVHQNNQCIKKEIRSNTQSHYSKPCRYPNTQCCLNYHPKDVHNKMNDKIQNIVHHWWISLNFLIGDELLSFFSSIIHQSHPRGMESSILICQMAPLKCRKACPMVWSLWWRRSNLSLLIGYENPLQNCIENFYIWSNLAIHRIHPLPNG